MRQAWSSARRTTVQIGEHTGEKKRVKPDELTEEEAKHLLAIIRAQASTEFGSIQQHAGTLDRAQDDEDRFWVMRVMAEELRHGYQMFHLLLSQDWSHVSGGVKGEQMVEEILSMQTGSHVLDAFNLEYDSFIDNICFAAFVDRVGKYQLTMQKVCAYKPMADSMPPMLREEAFHLAAGVIPMRRWAQARRAGRPVRHHAGDPEVGQQVVPARARDVRRRARRRHQREVRLQGHEEPRGAGPLHRGGARA